MFEDIWHCLLVSGCIFFVFWCLEGCFIWYGWYFGMPELLGGVWDSLHEGFSLTGANSPIWPNPEKQDVLSPDSFEASKYQNLPICHFQKLLSFAIFLIFRICQREITIYSLFGSPCSRKKWVLAEKTEIFWIFCPKGGGVSPNPKGF